MLNSGKEKTGEQKAKKSPTVKQKVINTYQESVLTLLNINQDYQKLRPEQIAFAVWASQPKNERGRLGDFAKKIGVSRVTLWNWQKHDVIKQLRFEVMISSIQMSTTDVLYNLAERASNTDMSFNAAPYIKIYLQFIEGWRENEPAVKPDIVVNFGFQPSKHIQPEDSNKSTLVEMANL